MLIALASFTFYIQQSWILLFPAVQVILSFLVFFLFFSLFFSFSFYFFESQPALEMPFKSKRKQRSKNKAEKYIIFMNCRTQAWQNPGQLDSFLIICTLFAIRVMTYCIAMALVYNAKKTSTGTQTKRNVLRSIKCS